MTPIPIIVDCDPGIDDTIALLTAFVSPELEILGITPVCGNQPLERTVRNALQVCELGQRTDIPVYAGCFRPMLREPIFGQFHGKTGLGNTVLPEPVKTVEPKSAVDFLIDTLTAAALEKKRVTVCCLGPMTNLAVALRMIPQVAEGIERIVMMGGAYREPGNRTMTAEFNVLADPHAAHVVFSSGIPIVALALDATHQVMLKPEHVAQFSNVSGRISQTLAELMAFWDRNDVRRYGSRGGPLHDPLVIAYLLAPHLFTTERARVFVEHESELCMGQTIADWYGKSGLEPNADIVTKVDAEGIVALFVDRLSRYAEKAVA
ncbi:nucleoside hydrolase [Neorhizobium galegae]|uniref:nucleoside hydrolase n=1 Tax=Neorhizobium galegae TaxID=399 RepID=UPI00062268DD|nr:nucleoside hydrolase [Neorhizobium galegae]CDZ63462.1 Pyrimidine-specific ribonucleoside hydrolase RihA [Neorhizobium galegae bv. orientalis]KAB1120477.1 nucleoside hydrolase [Neorhizobium galegae]MCQ1575235.1 nucleoside hydrolase [Neorhizobium galegae]MCQ1809075.1 nucleoside hydrolase [Neorhizobium galegae]MCQ1839266.1 nucleoside hydrolase [Neorhizobium galegae]